MSNFISETFYLNWHQHYHLSLLGCVDRNIKFSEWVFENFITYWRKEFGHAGNSWEYSKVSFYLNNEIEEGELLLEEKILYMIKHFAPQKSVYIYF